MNNIIDGKASSIKIKEELKTYVDSLDEKPGLVVIQVGDNPASNTYVKNKKLAAEYIGINFFHYKYEENTSEEELINKIKELNNDNSVDGIIVQLPLPKGFNETKIINYIDPNKDVDGLTELNAGKLVNNEDCLSSCTPTGIMKLLEMYNIEIEGKNAVVVGRSILVGKPIATMLLNKNATVTICHSKTKNLKEITKNADILVVATGHINTITEDMVNENAVVIDVGINRNEENKLCGDVDFNNIKDKVKLITPVPGGVGPMTVAMLNYNVIKSYKKRRGI